MLVDHNAAQFRARGPIKRKGFWAHLLDEAVDPVRNLRGPGQERRVTLDCQRNPQASMVRPACGKSPGAQDMKDL